MTIASLSFKNIISRPLGSMLSWLLFSFGTCIVVLIIQVSNQLQDEVTKNSAGIDLVVGAKGSPLQIILANIFHIDFPTGNISLKDAYGLTNSRYVKNSVPLSLGDSHKGYRLVGTTRGYRELYEAGLAEGSWNSAPGEAVIGSSVSKNLSMKIGDEFESQHGMDESGEAHEHHFTVKGILNPTGKVIDNLILVDLESIWLVHGHEEEAGSLVTLDKWDISITQNQYDNEEITALLIQYRSPMGAVLMPNMVNEMNNLQAASPAYEASRLFNILGIGIRLLNILGMVIIGISAVSVFISLFNSLKDRKYEMAIMRTMGATRSTIFSMILLEGLMITMAGIITGMIIGHGAMLIVSDQFTNSPFLFNITFQEWMLVIGCFVIGTVASVIPALMAYRTNISTTLSEG